MKISQKHMGKVVRVEFHDHSMNSDGSETAICKAYGEVFKLTRKNLILRQWECSIEDNDEFAAIVRGAIINVKVLE